MLSSAIHVSDMSIFGDFAANFKAFEAAKCTNDMGIAMGIALQEPSLRAKRVITPGSPTIAPAATSPQI